MKWIATLALALSMSTVQGQWTEDTGVNTPAGSDPSTIIRAMAASDGSTFIAFWRVAPAPTNMELRLQKLGVDGVPLFGADGIVVSADIAMSTFTVLATAEIDAEDNVYIGVTATEGELGHVFKLDAEGNHLWPSGGVTFSGGYGITIEPLSTGEALVAWLNVPNGLMQKYGADGTPIWSEPVPLVSGTSKTAPEALFELSTGGYTVLFHTYNFGISSTLWAQGYDVDGNETWAAPVQLSDKTTVWNTTYSSAQVGDVVYFGYMAATGLRFDSFLQRINPDGVLPWGINGSDFDTNETDYEMNTRIALDEDAGVAYALCNYKDPAQVDNGERIQRFDLVSGDRQLTDHGKVIYPIGSHTVHASDLHLAGGQPLFLLELGYDNGATPTTLHAVLLDAEGVFVWPEEMRPMGTFEASKSRTHMTAPVAGQSVAAWVETKESSPMIYAQNLSDAGLTGVAEAVSAVGPSLRAFPNPVSQALRIEGCPAGSRVEIRDAQGRSVLKTRLTEGSLNTSGLAPGCYTLCLEGRSGRLRFVKQ